MKILIPALWFFFAVILAPGQPLAGCCELRIEVRGAGHEPLAGANVDVSGPGRTLSDHTASNGNAGFTLPRPGTYTVSATKDGYLRLSRELVVTIGDRIIVEFVLLPHLVEAQTLAVTDGANPVSSTPANLVSGGEIRAAPELPATLRDALPLIPGVVRTVEGKLVISDAAEHRNSLLVDSLDATDPATGNFGVTVPIDSIVAFNVYKSPFLAEFGRFTSGVVTVETRGGGDTWHWELNDPTPELRILGGHIRGIRGFTPKLSFNGPLIATRFYISESVEYGYKKTPVRTLPGPYNEDNRQWWNTLTRLDYVVSGSQLLTFKLHAAPQRLMFYGLGFYNPQPVTPNYWGNEGMADVSHKINIAGGMLESAVSISQVYARVAGQGDAALVMTPFGNQGNYFMRQDRRAQKLEWLENWTPKPAGGRLKHHLKAGFSVLRAHARGRFYAQPVSVTGTRQELLERIRFSSRSGYRTSDWETGLYVHDHWILSPSLSIDGGIRFERQQITGMSRLAPRAGVAWSLFSRSSTILRAGAGWFYDRVPLNVFSFNSYPERTIVDYAHSGEIIAGPLTYENVLGTAHSDRALVFGPVQPGNFAPRSFVWRVELEQAFSDAVLVRAAYWQARARELIVLGPVAPECAMLQLNSEGRSESRRFELISRISMRRSRRLFLSYAHGQTQSNLNESSEFLNNYPYPLVRPDVFTTATANIPHRFLGWGVVPLTEPLKKSAVKLFPPSLAQLQWSRGWLAAPVVEYRTGYPYALVDERQNYAGMPNTVRFPAFFSLDLRLAKSLTVGKEHAAQISFSAFNLTNHWNPESVRWNTADPQLGEFLGQRPRRFRIDFDLLF